MRGLQDAVDSHSENGKGERTGAGSVPAPAIASVPLLE
jgi:hypothetical protein